ncbi:MAG: NAD-dependent epimerase/dehydratase family protein [bacterium]
MLSSIRNSRVLVTGGTGFIGSYLVKRLLSEGADLHVLRRKTSGAFRLDGLESRVHSHTVDYRDLAGLTSTVRRINPQKIFHLAAHTDVGRTMDNCSRSLESIIISTLNLIRALEGVDYEIFVNTGTCEEYGDNPAPFRESQIPNPVSPYSAAKVSTTMYCRMFHKTMGLPIVTLRPFLTYGPGQEPRRFIPQAIKAALNGEEFKMTQGEQTREFNYVEDIVEGYLLAATTPEAIGRIINIGNGKEYQLRELVEKIFLLAGAETRPVFGGLPYRPGETWHFYCDNRLAREILGWKPKYSLDEGLKLTIEAMR